MGVVFPKDTVIHKIHSLRLEGGVYAYCGEVCTLWVHDWNKVTCKDCLIAKEEKDGCLSVS
jgi:hypothetical protein